MSRFSYQPTHPFQIIPSKHRRGSVPLLKLSAGVNLHQSRTFEKSFANIVKKSDRTNFFPKKYNKRKHCHICNNRLTNNESTKKCGRLSATPPIIATPAARHSQCTFSPDFLVALRTSGGRWNPYFTRITLYRLIRVRI